MAEVIPFRGVLYNPDKVDASAVMAPPYDVISPAFKETLYERDPCNIIRIDFGKDSDDDSDTENRYTRAAKHLSDWLENKVFIHDSEPVFYCYEISYVLDDREMKTRGFLGAVKIEELGKGRVHPHEMTYSKPKSDRLNILRYCNANTSPIFSLYSSKEKLASSVLDEVAKEKPFIEASDEEGFSHRLWRISSPEAIESIKRDMSDRDVFIADGHHRYETAQAFQKEMQEKGLSKTGDEPFNYVLMFLSNMEDDGLTLLPTHRIVEVDSDIVIKSRLKKYFDIKKISADGKSDKEAKEEMFIAMKGSKHSFGMYLTNTSSYYILSFNGSDIDIDLPDSLKELDVTILHKFVFEKLLKIEHFEYEMDPDISVERAKKGSFEAVFFLNPTKIHDVRDAALAGHRMPPKSTYFYPKLLTGMVIYKF
jgi:uncharacterized protein (DUF1015 family)